MKTFFKKVFVTLFLGALVSFSLVNINNIDKVGSIENSNNEDSPLLHNDYSKVDSLPSGLDLVDGFYQISNIADYKIFTDYFNNNSINTAYSFKLMNDLVINNTTYADYKPVGVNAPFVGNLDGNNHTITFDYDFIINATSTLNRFSLFSTIGKNSSIKNLVLNSTISLSIDKTTYDKPIFVGGLSAIVTENKDTFTNIDCTSDITITYDANDDFASSSNLYVGGLFGSASYTTLDDVNLTSSIDCLSTTRYHVPPDDRHHKRITTFFTNTPLKEQFESIYIGGAIGYAYAEGSDADFQYINSEINISSFNIGDVNNKFTASSDGFNSVGGVFGYIETKVDLHDASILGHVTLKNLNVKISNVMNYFQSGNICGSLFCGFIGEFTLSGPLSGSALLENVNINVLTDTIIGLKGDYPHYGLVFSLVMYCNLVVRNFTFTLKNMSLSANQELSYGNFAASIVGGDTSLTNFYIYMDGSLEAEVRRNDNNQFVIACLEIPTDSMSVVNGYIHVGDYDANANNSINNITFENFYTNYTSETVFHDFVSDNLKDLNNKVATLNGDLATGQTPYKTWTLTETLGIYPVFGVPAEEPSEDEPVVPTIPYGQEFNIIYNTKDGVINDENYPTTYICGVGVTLPISVTKANYDFSGWSTRNLSGVIITRISNRQYGDVYLNANYTISSSARKNIITYKTNGGSIVGEYKTSYLDEEVTLPTEIVRYHADFDGWYENENFTGKRIYKISSTETGDKTYYAKYVYEVYSIIYYLGNGKINEDYVTTYHVNEEVILPTNVTLDGAKFIGFSETPNDKDHLVTKIYNTEVGTKVYYAVYEENANYTWIYILIAAIVVALGAGITILLLRRKNHK